MKSIILKALAARELRREKSLIVEKVAAEPPFEMGDVLFIREPWYRLTDPSTGEPSGRFSYAADATAEPIAYRWASPVSMPSEAVRIYARVVGLTAKAETSGEEVVQSWEIELELIDKRLAEAADEGLPVSTADDPDDASTYFTYAGDMTPEDHEKMIATIDADRERLGKIRARRRELKNSRHAPTDLIKREFEALSEEERDIVAALEDAGVPVEPSDEEKEELTEEAFDALTEIDLAERKREIEPRLAEIASRLEVIADILKSPDQFTSEAIEEVETERAELYEELELLKQEISGPVENPDEGGAFGA